MLFYECRSSYHLGVVRNMIGQGRVIISILSAVLLILLAGCSSVPIDKTVRFEVEGKWGWAHNEKRCVEHWHRITEIDEGKLLKFENPEPIERHNKEVTQSYTYVILSRLENGYHLRMNGETRKNDQGELVTWYLLFDDRNTYRWRRSDWSDHSRTKPIVRCNQ